MSKAVARFFIYAFEIHILTKIINILNTIFRFILIKSVWFLKNAKKYGTKSIISILISNKKKEH